MASTLSLSVDNLHCICKHLRVCVLLLSYVDGLDPCGLFLSRFNRAVDRTGDQPIAWPLPTQDSRNTEKYSCLLWDSNPPIPLFELSKTFHALDHTLTVIGVFHSKVIIIWPLLYAIRDVDCETLLKQNTLRMYTPLKELAFLNLSLEIFYFSSLLGTKSS